MVDRNSLPGMLKLEEARELVGKDKVGENRFLKMAQRNEIPGVVNIGLGSKPVWRVKTKPFLDWLNGETDQNKTPHGAA